MGSVEASLFLSFAFWLGRNRENQGRGKRRNEVYPTWCFEFGWEYLGWRCSHLFLCVVERMGISSSISSFSSLLTLDTPELES
jgi:hypothetical protein